MIPWISYYYASLMCRLYVYTENIDRIKYHCTPAAEGGNVEAQSYLCERHNKYSSLDPIADWCLPLANKNVSFAQNIVGIQRLHNHKHTESESWFRRAIVNEKKPTSRSSYLYNLANSLYVQNKLDESEEFFQQYINSLIKNFLNQENDSLYSYYKESLASLYDDSINKLGKIKFKNGDIESAIEIFKIGERYNSFKNTNDLGGMHLLTQKYEKAEKYFKKTGVIWEETCLGHLPQDSSHVSTFCSDLENQKTYQLSKETLESTQKILKALKAERERHDTSLETKYMTFHIQLIEQGTTGAQNTLHTSYEETLS